MLTTVVGHYPKLPSNPDSPNLRRAIAQMDSGRMNESDLAQVVKQVTAEVVQEQVDAGVDLPTDGQIGWEDGQTPFARGLKGFEINGLIRYFDTNTYYRQPIPQEMLQWQGPITVDQFRHAQAISPCPLKAVLTGPYTLGRLSQLGCYSSLNTLVMDLAHALNQEALALQEAGATFIQFDEPSILQHKQDFQLLQEASQIVTHGVTVKTEICTWFGNLAGVHREFFQLPFQVFGLDLVMGRDSWELLDDLPPGTELAAGIIDARNTRLETVDHIVECVKRLSQQVSSDHLYLCPSAGLEYLPRTTAKDKLVRLVEGARRAQEVL